MSYSVKELYDRWSDDVEGRVKISQVLIAVILGILIIYSYMNLSLPRDPKQRSWTKLNRVLIEQAAETFLTGFAYVESGEGGSVFEWVAKTAMEMMPLGTYIEGKLTSYTDVEDMETIQMILANQANDENMVDENGKLVKEDGKE